MTDEWGDEDGRTRGEAIRDRFEALGISGVDWHDRTGIARQTLARAMEDDERMRPQTFASIEAALDRLEAHVGKAVEHDLGAGMVAITAKDHNRTITVEGPVADIEKLQRAVAELLSRQSDAEDNFSPGTDVS
jgi:hypothetical protein